MRCACCRYCGKQVKITYQGREIKAPNGGDYFVWDGCEACASMNRIDFSVPGLKNINSNACNLGVVPGVSYTITDVQVQPFVP